MSLVKIQGNASGTGTLTIAAPNTNTDFTLTLPTETATLLTPFGIGPGIKQGLTLSNNGTDATNDIDVAAGKAVDTTGAVVMSLASTMVKRLDANWAAGTNQGGRYSGAAIANTTYHVWLVAKAAGADVDVYMAPSAVASTVLGWLQAESGGSAYLYLWRIGSIIRSAGAILPFLQDGNVFYLAPALAEVNGTTSYGTSVQQTLAYIPDGINVDAMLSYGLVDGSASQTGMGIFPDGITNPTISANIFAEAGASSGGRGFNTKNIRTDTSRRVRVLVSASASNVFIYITTLGWVDQKRSAS